MGLRISNSVTIPDDEISLSAMRAQGAGGQNVNKVSSAIHLRFDIPRSSLPEVYRERLLARSDRRINSDGILIIKAQRFRSQEKNRADALERLRVLVQSAGETPRTRKPSRPSAANRQKRTDDKTRRGRLKALRGKVQP